jgi:phospholipid transport system substrate-binding protein
MQTNLHISRRSVVLSLAGLVAFAPTMASALTEVQASQLIDKVVLDLNRIISSGKSEVGMYPDFERLFNTYADVPIIAQSALGVQWRSASSSQQSAYIAAFRTYMARKYGKRFREFIGGKITVTGLKKFTWGYLVNSTANLPGSSPFALDWQVSDKSGASKMFNIYIEGISLLTTERTEIGAMLDKRNGDLNRLIADLKAM